ncbi:late competence development ComFB family protein [Leptolyngbya sp. KIOST-1]|uniref:late competence development ComFB family protein n=1 Tax=Leptolyngbya sp. KIOST-1 TaxID=1229172 RepID=UPI0006919801|nr:late competence development ComFB family protein [Leptolyngbya sp. KIOST-1]
MELLVAEEVDKQVKTMHPRMLKYLKRVEVETYALNRLPSLYASSEKGWQLQYEKAKRELHNQIKSAVRQAFAAVQVDPIRASQPLRGQEDEAANVALNALREILKQPDLSWDGAINRLRTVLGRRSDGALPTADATDTSHRTRYRDGAANMTSAERADGSHAHYWRPGTYGSDVSWQKTHTPSETGFDWNDARYSK